MKTEMYRMSLDEALRKLACYEDLEDEGRLMEVVYGFNKCDHDSAFECSVCGFVDWDTLASDDVKYNYCPRCGAKIDKEKAEAKLAETEDAK